MYYLHALSRRKTSFLVFLCLFFALTQISLAVEIENTRRASTITGMVYDEQRNPIQRVDVELSRADVGGASFIKTKTDGTGRYQFSNVEDGTYRIKVMPFQYNLKDDSRNVVVHTVSLLGGGSGFFNEDFYLKRKTEGLSDTTTGVVFIQKVPNEAESLYKEGVEAISDNRSADGMQKLAKAIEVFPKYYAALQTLGFEFAKKGKYLEAAKLFIRAAEANPKSSKSFYFMGFSFNKLGKKYNQAALKALEKASVLAPASWKVVLLAGKIERQEGNFDQAEKHLLRAKKLSDRRQPEIHKELTELYSNDLKQYGKAADEFEAYMKATDDDDEKNKQILANLRKKANSGS